MKGNKSRNKSTYTHYRSDGTYVEYDQSGRIERDSADGGSVPSSVAGWTLDGGVVYQDGSVSYNNQSRDSESKETSTSKTDSLESRID